MDPNLRQSTKWLGWFTLLLICAVLMQESGYFANKQKHPAEDSAIEAMAEVKPPEVDPIESDAFEKIEVTATGYTAGPESTGKEVGHPEYGITYSGVKVRRAEVSTIAADPKVFPIGSILFIPGYGYGIVADTGSAIKGNKIDLYFETKEQVFSLWGKKTVQVLLIKKGDGKLSEELVENLNKTVVSKGHLLDLVVR